MSENSRNNPARFRLFRAGGLQLAVADEHVNAVTEWTEPTPLPFAAKAVLGVVCIQGRMFTVLDPVRLIRPEETGTKTSPRLILALRGDEQLALAIDKTEEPIEVPRMTIKPIELGSKDLIRDAIKYEGSDWQVLNVDELFHSVVRGRERRRHRFLFN